jgi:hypothetical protein
VALVDYYRYGSGASIYKGYGSYGPRYFASGYDGYGSYGPQYYESGYDGLATTVTVDRNTDCRQGALHREFRVQSAA